MAKIVELIVACESLGTGSDSNPFRRQATLWTKEGKLICSYDTFLKEGRVSPEIMGLIND